MSSDEMPQCSLQFIGTATALLRLGPFTLLTDPNFLHRGQRAYLGYGLSSRRRTEPALQIGDLPALDAVLLSHMHGDHWDRVAKRGIDRSVPILTTPKAARALRRQHFSAGEGLATWQRRELRKDGQLLRVTAMPGRHAKGIARHLLPPVMGAMLEYEPRARGVELRLYVTGDTLFVDDLREIPRRYPAIQVAVVHLGGTTLPGGFVVTMDAQEGAALVELIRPESAIPVHYDDYGVFKSPLADFLDEMRARGLEKVVAHVPPGHVHALQ